MAKEREGRADQRSTSELVLSLWLRGVKSWNAERNKNPDTIVNLRGASLHHRELFGVNFKGAHLEGANFLCSVLACANLKGAHLDNATLVESVLDSAHLEDASLVGANLREARLDNALLHNAHLEFSVLEGAHLTRADFEGAFLQESDLSYSRAVGASFKNAQLFRADFSHSNLNGVNFSGANLRESRLIKADLRTAKLIGASLQNTTLTDADLSGANLSNSYVYGASVFGIKTDAKTIQTGLVISKPNEPFLLTVGDLEAALELRQNFDRKGIGKKLEALTNSQVLILGRFNRMEYLRAIEKLVLASGKIPIIFTFENAITRNLIETVIYLASTSGSIIADLSSGSSIQDELRAIIPVFESIPLLPLFSPTREHPDVYATFSSSIATPRNKDRILEVLHYKSLSDLIPALKAKLPVLEKARLSLTKNKSRKRE